MTPSWDKISELAIETLSPEERESSAVYLDKQTLSPGIRLEIDSQTVDISEPIVVAFVDLHPQLNWGHDCRYLLINPDTHEIRSIEAQFPPFLRGTPETLSVIWQGQNVPDWTLAT